jgi:hypothetical protein
MASRASSASSRLVLCGGNYRDRVRGAFVTILDIEMRHGRATGRLLAVETSGAVRLPFVCRKEDLVLASTRTAAGEESAPAAGAPRQGRRSP